MIKDGNFFPFFWKHGQHIPLRTASYYGKPLASVYDSAGLAFPMQSYYQTLQIPVHHQGFEIFVCNFTTFNQSVINHKLFTGMGGAVMPSSSLMWWWCNGGGGSGGGDMASLSSSSFQWYRWWHCAAVVVVDIGAWWW